MTNATLYRIRRSLVWVLLLALGATACLFVLAIVFQMDRAIDETWPALTLLLGAYCLPAVLCANLLCKRRFMTLMWSGIVVSGLAFLSWQPLVWFNMRGLFNDERMIRVVVFVGVLLTVYTGWVGLFALLQTQKWTSPPGRFLMLLTLALGTMLAASICAEVIFEPRELWRATLTLTILTAFGVLASMAVALTTQRRHVGTGETLASTVVVDLKCPRCRSEQSLHTGLAKCTSCGLRIEINVEEPACACGYQLYQLRGDTCPECGRAIDPADRWADAPGSDPTTPSIVT